MTVISADSLDGDIWTTLLFGLGVEKGCAARASAAGYRRDFRYQKSRHYSLIAR
ncbi:hypothetical protein LNP74_21430 [Klebsiella pneumoniae subsp. pneumoniae]|nr:hypothetical protein [Klebsiella pneumoniae subsp. pneumoniae]